MKPSVWLPYGRVRALALVAGIAILLIVPSTALDLSPGSSQTSLPTISPGDPVYIHGIATGHPSNGLQIWLIGTNYVKIDNVMVNDDNTYTYELKPADTRDLAFGQYVVLIQHPMMNGQFDITYDPATGRVINRQTGTAIFQLTGPGSLQSPDSAAALMQAINSQNVDDTFASVTFNIGNSNTFINPVGDHLTGDQFTIGGSTNLATGDNLLVQVTSASFYPTKKTQPSGVSGASGMVTVVQGSEGYNQWSFKVNTTGWIPDEYIVQVSGITVTVTGSTTFNLLPQMPVANLSGTPAVPATPLTVTIIPAVVNLTTANPPTTKKAPVSTWAGIVALAGAVMILRIKKI